MALLSLRYRSAGEEPILRPAGTRFVPSQGGVAGAEKSALAVEHDVTEGEAELLGLQGAGRTVHPQEDAHTRLALQVGME